MPKTDYYYLLLSGKTFTVTENNRAVSQCYRPLAICSPELSKMTAIDGNSRFTGQPKG